MSQNLHTLLRTAAEMRSGGSSWDEVARRVHRTAGTCASWPRRHPRTWAAFYREAAQARHEEAGNEALFTLRTMLRGKDLKAQDKSAEVLLKYIRSLPAAENSVAAPASAP